MQKPDLETVNRTLSAVVQKQEKELLMLRRALLDAANKLERAGWLVSASVARDAAN